MNSRSWTVAALLIALGASGNQALASGYTALQLQPLHPGESVIGRMLNNQGEAIGSSGTGVIMENGSPVPFATSVIWQNGQPTQFTVPWQHRRIELNYINDRGDVLGWSQNYGEREYFVTRNGRTEFVKTPYNFTPHSINGQGQVAGITWDAKLQLKRPAIWSGGSQLTLPPNDKIVGLAIDDVDAFGAIINENGDVAGTLDHYLRGPYLWRNGQAMTAVGGGYVDDMNNHGDILVNLAQHFQRNAYILKNGKDLQPFGIYDYYHGRLNDKGQVLADNILVSDFKVQPLHNLVPDEFSAAGWRHPDGVDLNDAGQLLVSAYGAGDRLGLFILTPVPEPGAWLQGLAGLSLLGMYARRRRLK